MNTRTVTNTGNTDREKMKQEIYWLQWRKENLRLTLSSFSLKNSPIIPKYKKSLTCLNERILRIKLYYIVERGANAQARRHLSIGWALVETYPARRWGSSARILWPEWWEQKRGPQSVRRSVQPSLHTQNSYIYHNYFDYYGINRFELAYKKKHFLPGKKPYNFENSYLYMYVTFKLFIFRERT